MGNKKSKKSELSQHSPEASGTAGYDMSEEVGRRIEEDDVLDQRVENPKHADFEARIDKINEKFERFDEFIVAKFASSTKIIDEAEEKHVKQVSTTSISQKKRFLSSESHTSLMIQRLKQVFIVNIKEGSSKPFSVARKALGLVGILSLHPPAISPVYNIRLRLTNTLTAFKKEDFDQINSQHFHRINRDVSSIKTHVNEFGSSGNAQGFFREPFGIAIHPHTGNYFIMNKDNQRVDEFTPDFTFVRSYGNQNAETILSYARGLAFNPSGTVLAVADTLNHRIQFWDMSGELLSEIDRFGTSLRLQSAQFVAYDSDENLYVADKSGRVIYKFNKEHEYLMSIGGPDSEKPIGEVGGMMINDYGELMAIAVSSNEVKFYSNDGQFIRSVLILPTGTVENAYSNHLARGPDCFIVSDTSGFVRFYKYDGTLLNSLEMKVPVGTAFDLNSRLVVVDYRGCHIKTF